MIARALLLTTLLTAAGVAAADWRTVPVPDAGDAFTTLYGIAAAVGQKVEENATDTAHVGAFLFGYTPKPGMATQFERGYGRHLEWHAAQRDSLTWLAWTVATGASPGTFIDGVFGVRFGAMDERVAPREDAADADVNVSPFADPVLRAVYRLRPELGASRALEQGEPAPLQIVVDVTLRPGSQDTLAVALGRMREIDVAVYERIAGGARPGFLLIAQLASWDALPAAEDAIAGMLEDAGDAIERAASDVWARRTDLIYRPGGGGGDSQR